VYESMVREFSWDRMIIKNLSKNPKFKLEYFDFEYYHQIVLNETYQDIASQGLLKKENVLFKQNSAGENLFLLIFKRAPLKVLYEFMGDLSYAMAAWPDKAKLTNKRGQTFLHLLLENRKIPKDAKAEFLLVLNGKANLQLALQIADVNNLLPLTLFIELFASELRENLAGYLKIIDILTPKVDIFSFGEFNKYDLFVYHSLGHIKENRVYLKEEVTKDFWEFFHRDLIFNQQIIKVCLVNRLDELLIKLLSTNNFLTLDDFFVENLGNSKHIFTYLYEKKNKELIELLASKYVKHPFYRLSPVPALMKDFKTAAPSLKMTDEEFLRHFNYSIFNIILDTILLNGHDSDMYDVAIKIFEELWAKLKTDEKVESLLAISRWKKNSKRKYMSLEFHPLLTKMMATKNTNLINYVK